MLEWGLSVAQWWCSGDAVRSSGGAVISVWDLSGGCFAQGVSGEGVGFSGGVGGLGKWVLRLE